MMDFKTLILSKKKANLPLDSLSNLKFDLALSKIELENLIRVQFTYKINNTIYQLENREQKRKANDEIEKNRRVYYRFRFCFRFCFCFLFLMLQRNNKRSKK